MGITGLLPFLDKAAQRVHVSEFRGCTVGIDSYCWLHKGAFGCAEKLSRGEDTNGYVLYCMKYIKLLQSYNIRPILVFDGQHLLAKSLTEKKRRDLRQLSKMKASELLRLGKIDEARNYMRQSIDVTHKMAFALIQECRRNNIDCIVAPYEADAQLAFLNIQKMIHFVITEDSDLVLFGCSKVFFKMDAQGFGTLVNSDKIHVCMNLRPDNFTFDKFRQMCILSGCDYLESLPGVGLKKALKFVTMTADPSIYNVLSKLPSYLKLNNLVVTDNYRDAFMVAEATVMHQIVFDPILRKLKPLSDPEACGTKLEYCRNAGKLFDNNVALQLALGNIDPFTRDVMDNWSPDLASVNLHHASIWSGTYTKPIISSRKSTKLEAPDTKALSTVVTLSRQEEIDYDSKWQGELERYTIVEQPSKKQKTTVPERSPSPVLSKDLTVVPFKKLSKFRRSNTDTNTLLTSRFFSGKNTLWDCIDQYSKESTRLKTTDEKGSNDTNLNNDDQEIVVCEPDVHGELTPTSNSNSPVDFTHNLQVENEMQSPETFDTCDNSTVSLKQLENDMNAKNTSLMCIGHDSDSNEKKEEKPKTKVVLTPHRRLGLPPVKKNQPTILDMFSKMKKVE